MRRRGEPVRQRCEQCGGYFAAAYVWNRVRRFCSKSCAMRHRNRAVRQPEVIVLCERPGCGVAVTLPEWRARGRRFCSRRCSGIVTGSRNVSRETSAVDVGDGDGTRR